MAQIKWSKKAPKTPGIYWIRNTEMPNPMLVYFDEFDPETGELVDRDGAGWRFYDHCEIAGPINPPK